MTMPIFYKIHRLSMDQKSSRAVNDDATLHNLISEQEWTSVDHLLTQSFKLRRSLSVNVSLSSSVTITDDLILHYALNFNAPLQIIMKLSSRFLSSMDAADACGRYCIHVAVASGCAPDVIKFFVQMRPKFVGLRDRLGKTPMHYAGEGYANKFVDNYFDFPDFREVHKNTTLQVVEILVKVAPQSVNIEDEDEMNPIEYALLTSTNIKVIKTMQRASLKDWRRRKPVECQSQEDLAKELQGRSSSPTSYDQQAKAASQLAAKPIFSQSRQTLHHRLGTITA